MKAGLFITGNLSVSLRTRNIDGNQSLHTNVGIWLLT